MVMREIPTRIHYCLLRSSHEGLGCIMSCYNISMGMAQVQSVVSHALNDGNMVFPFNVHVWVLPARSIAKICDRFELVTTEQAFERFCSCMSFYVSLQYLSSLSSSTKIEEKRHSGMGFPWCGKVKSIIFKNLATHGNSYFPCVDPAFVNKQTNKQTKGTNS